jgi:hypothetical protein
VKFVPYIGGMYTPSFTPRDEHSLCLEEWRCEKRFSHPGDNFTLREQNLPLETTSPLGANFDPQLRMGLWFET